MQKKYILALDQGTTSSRAVIFNRRSEILGIKSVPLRQIYPEPGWVEHDPEEIWKGQLEALRGVIEDTGISPEEIACIGITNQRETVIVWDKNTGRPVYNGIVWQCRRTAAKCDEIKARGLDTMIRDKTGLVVDAYFSATKIQWILDNVEGVRERALAGELLAGTVDTWLVWNLTGGQLHVTDYTNASRTMLFNINTLEWDRELLETFGIPESMLPKVIPSSGIVGETVEEILGVRIPISGIAGDQQSALFGQGCFEKECAKNTYGTGCFILMNVGKIPVKSNNNLLTTIAWGIGEEIEYALEGSVFNAGSSIQWLRDELKIIETARQADIDAEKVDDTGGVYVVPAYTGLGAPYWDPYARGIIIGITRGTRREHIIRATLESIAFQSRDVFEAMKADAGTEVKVLQVDGGVSVSPFCMQFQADILGIPVNRPAVTETTALGAAHLAGLAVGIWKDKLDIRKEFAEGKTFMPAMDEKTREDKYARWKRAVERSRNWVAE
ncbi:glycerol kinase [Clostridium thermosuccinogenes]|uniref:Glycerol kinase n=1 Tax=Clostridium thermosuccinogenes TaxID=84032 RepID=A0A2K2FMY0_9CLOT|nr:glycerol kinase GlpK [Pseudoclostridium thermosuccinogenes]AUS97837.1 glycerol kinase [Pseudoclostridium thermosuccinogenes]PNU00133.1 glycerol kinase [Pseudoclostridium thermosuccinogenes]PNU01458.1 glycerol kinase [Pseudoclostridium thermosuccinogenes]